MLIHLSDLLSQARGGDKLLSFFFLYLLHVKTILRCSNCKQQPLLLVMTAVEIYSVSSLLSVF